MLHTCPTERQALSTQLAASVTLVATATPTCSASVPFVSTTVDGLAVKAAAPCYRSAP